MFDYIYQTLTNFGYNHPVHPTLTHVPIGMVMGAFIFVLIAVMTRKKNLAQTARHCSVLALIAAVPTALLGLMDWQHFYGRCPYLCLRVAQALAQVGPDFGIPEAGERPQQGGPGSGVAVSVKEPF